MEHNKKFLIIGNTNAITYKEVLPLIKENKLWLGVSSFNKGMYFIVDDDFVYADSYKFDKEKDGKKVSRVSSICWFTNLDHKRRHEEAILYKKYNEEEYPKYDNYDAINVDKYEEIPLDYDGVMGVPVTFLDKYCPEQFEIIGGFNGYKESDEKNGLICGSLTEYIDKNDKIKLWTGPTINKKAKYYRLLIRTKK